MNQVRGQLVALLVVTSFYWLAVALMSSASVASAAWGVLFLVCAGGSLLLPRFQAFKFSPAAWLYFAFCFALLAAIFFGANFGLDALHGASRSKTEVAAKLGGLELWFILFPGASSVALACGAAGAMAPRLCRTLPPETSQ